MKKLALQNKKKKKSSPQKKSKSKILLKSILVPTDFSAGANKALQYALTFAKQFDAKIELMHVVEPMLFPSDSVFNQPVIQPIFPSIDLEQRKIDEEKLKSIVVEIKKEYSKISYYSTTGTPHEEVIEYIKNKKIDLIILAAHTQNKLEHFFFGSTTEKIMLKASCPVLILHEDEKDFIKLKQTSHIAK